MWRLRKRFYLRHSHSKKGGEMFYGVSKEKEHVKRDTCIWNMRQECRAGFQGFACQPRQISGKERKKRKKVIVSGTKVGNNKPCYPGCSRRFDWSFPRSCSNQISNMTLGWRGGDAVCAGTMPHCSEALRQPPLKSSETECELFSVCVDKGPITFLMKEWKRRSYGQSIFRCFGCRSGKLQEVWFHLTL